MRRIRPLALNLVLHLLIQRLYMFQSLRNSGLEGSHRIRIAACLNCSKELVQPSFNALRYYPLFQLCIQVDGGPCSRQKVHWDFAITPCNIKSVLQTALACVFLHHTCAVNCQRCDPHAPERTSQRCGS